MPRLWWLSPALLAACAAAPPPAEIPVRGETPGHICKATGTATFIGRSKTGKNAAAIKRATSAAVLRWAPPGMMMTMDYRADRVTVYLGPNRKITRINCG
jgi:hypothetical protein